MNLRFIVKRDSNDEMTFATVTAVVDKPLSLEFARNDGAFLAALKKALTKWAKTTKKGKAAWESSSHDFNVGDLDGYLPASNELNEILASFGILDLKVDILSEDHLCNWSYDTVLIDMED